jgi:hypothetical protein
VSDGDEYGGFDWRFQQERQGGVRLSRWLARLLPGLRHRSDYGTQEGVDSFRRPEYRGNVRFENNDYNAFRHLFSKPIRLGSAVIEPILLPDRVAYGLMFLTGGHFCLYAQGVLLCGR